MCVNFLTLAPPRFVVTPEEIIYVNIGDAIILNCQADGTPKPEIVWFKDEHPVDLIPPTGIFNEGTELRIGQIKPEDIGDYTCIARNGEGQISHTARVIVAGKHTLFIRIHILRYIYIHTNCECILLKAKQGIPRPTQRIRINVQRPPQQSANVSRRYMVLW